MKKLNEETLIIPPVAVLEQWKKVIHKSGMNIYIPQDGKWVLENQAGKYAQRVHLIGYEAALRKRSLVASKWDRVIYDEAHRLASGNTSTDLAKLIVTDHMWLITGTPIVNKVRDLKVLLEICGVKMPHTMDLETLSPIFQKYILARSMNQLRASIPDAPPEPVHKDIVMDFATEAEREFYNGMSGLITRRWRALEADSAGPNGLEKFKLFMRLRQLSLHPQIYIAARKKALKSLYTRPDWTELSTKFEKIRELVCQSEVSHKWIVFCHFHQEMEMLADMLKMDSRVELVQQYHGGLTAAEKQDVLERAQMPLAEGKQEVLLVQLQSGGTGLNLQHFDQIIFTGPWWTKALMEQAVGRAVRIGQRKTVTVYNLRLLGEEALNIDAFMSEKASSKGELCRNVLAHANNKIETYL